MTQSQIQLAASADYADALLTARRAKSIILSLLLFILLAQLLLFLWLRYEHPLAKETANSRAWAEYFIGLLDFAGIILPALLTITICLILHIQLVGRLLGTARSTAAFFYSVLLGLFLFPWQSVLNNPAINNEPLANNLGAKIPGVLYTWAEISHPIVGANFSTDPKVDLTVMIFHWIRYVAFPLLAMLIVAIIHLQMHKSLRQSLGENRLITTTPAV